MHSDVGLRCCTYSLVARSVRAVGHVNSHSRSTTDSFESTAAAGDADASSCGISAERPRAPHARRCIRCCETQAGGGADANAGPTHSYRIAAPPALHCRLTHGVVERELWLSAVAQPQLGMSLRGHPHQLCELTAYNAKSSLGDAQRTTWLGGVGMAGAGRTNTRGGASRVLHPPAASAALQRQLGGPPDGGARTPLCSPSLCSSPLSCSLRSQPKPRAMVRC
jgi:hypothetical protein